MRVRELTAVMLLHWVLGGYVRSIYFVTYLVACQACGWPIQFCHVVCGLTRPVWPDGLCRV